MENKNTFSLLFFGIKKRMNSKGEIPLHMRITVNREKKEMSLHRSIDSELWDSTSGSAIGNTKKAKIINNYLLSIQSLVYDKYKYLREMEKEVTAQSVKNAFLGIKDKGKMILEIFQEHNDKMRKLINIDVSAETVQRYETSYRHTENFIKKYYNREDLYLKEINHKFITDYELFFKTERKCSHNTTMKYIKNFKKIIRIALANGWLKDDPFANYKMKLKKVDRDFLSDDELNTLMNKTFANKRLEQVRDCFLFSCFTGLAHSDLKRLAPGNIQVGTDGGTWVKIHRKKTNGESNIPILPVTAQLIEKYKDDEYCILNKTLLPVLSNQKMNAYLKEIADICDINKNLTSHIARHTFATTVTLNNDVPIETVSKMLGHSSINMTKTYARLLDNKVGRDMQHLNDKYSLSV